MLLQTNFSILEAGTGSAPQPEGGTLSRLRGIVPASAQASDATDVGFEQRRHGISTICLRKVTLGHALKLLITRTSSCFLVSLAAETRKDSTRPFACPHDGINLRHRQRKVSSYANRSIELATPRPAPMAERFAKRGDADTRAAPLRSLIISFAEADT